MNFARRVFFVAGLYGILILPPQYFLENKTGRDFPPPITHPEHFYGFIGVALAWQICFFVIARDPVRHRPIMIPALLEKVAFGGATIVLFLQQRLAVPVLAAGLIDLTFAALFLAAFKVTPARVPAGDPRATS